MKQRIPIFLFIFLLSVTYGATVGFSQDNTRPAKGFSVVKRTIDVIGGMKKLKSIKNTQISSSIQRFEPQQTFSPGDAPMLVADIKRTLTNDLASHQTRTDWLVNAHYPASNTFKYTEIISGKDGIVDGLDNFFSSTAQIVAMKSTRLAARTKQYTLTSPIALLQMAIAQRKHLRYRGSKKINGQPQYLVSMPGWNRPITFYIDEATKYITKVETFEDDTINGDTLLEVWFDRWAKVEEISLPYSVSLALAKQRIAVETRDTITLNVDVSDNLFSIPANQISAYDSNQYDWGIRSSQWFNRLLPLGVPFDIDQRDSETVNIVEVTTGIFHILGVTHNSMVIEMNNYLILFDPVLYDDRTQSIVDAIRAKWPDKALKYVIASHFHNDHVGGIRGYAAIGASLIVGKNTENHYFDILETPHTIYPDALSRTHDAETDVITVGTDKPYVLTDGSRVVQIWDIPNSHTTGMLMPYINDVKTIFVSDLYNPAAFPAPFPALFSVWALDLDIALKQLNIPVDYLVGSHGGTVPFSQFESDIEALR